MPSQEPEIASTRFVPSSATPIQLAQATAWLERWTEILNLQAWTIRVEHVDDVRDAREITDPENACWACTTVSLPYLRATIRLHSAFWDPETCHDPEMIFLHEMLHIVTAPTRTLARKVVAEEKFVTWDTMKEAYETQTDVLAKVIWELQVSRLAVAGPGYDWSRTKWAQP